MSEIIVEIRAGEGGDDAKDLVNWQFDIYSKYARKRGLEIDLIYDRPGIIIFEVSGKKAQKAFENETGGHRVQRIPSTEKRGRVHTSTITVAVLPIHKGRKVQIDNRDLDWKFCRGSGAGGQHRNVTDSAVQLTHLPTGTQVRIESERSQHANKELALEILEARLQENMKAQQVSKRASKRKAQVGSGMRADKRRTIRVRDDQVKDHVTGKSWSYKKYARGDW